MTLFDFVDTAVWLYVGFCIGDAFDRRFLEPRRRRRANERWIAANVAAGTDFHKR